MKPTERFTCKKKYVHFSLKKKKKKKKKNVLIHFLASENCYHDDENQQTDYMAGYTGCLAEVSKFLTKTNGIGQELKEKIIKHMTEKVRDSNNNVSPEGENLSKPANKIPISRDPSKSLTESTDFRPAKKSDAEAKPESKSGDKDTFLPGNTTPMAQEFSNNFQNSATGLFPGSQVLLVLQLPPAQNMMASNPITGQFSNMANISNSAIPVLQAESTHEAIDLSQPQSNVIKNVLNPHHPTRQTVDDPAAILGSSFKNCDIYTQNMRSVQNLPLNLCTNNRKNELPSDDDPWRPW